MEKPTYYIASFSGGKDSTAMVLRLIELGEPLDEVMFCDTDLRNFLVDYAAYCNQPSMFKSLTFPEFLNKRREAKDISEKRRLKDLDIYNQEDKQDERPTRQDSGRRIRE